MKGTHFYKEKIPAGFGDLNFAQKDALLRNIAAEWIAENPVKYLSQLPLKAAVLFGFDTWSERFKRGGGLSSIREKILSDKAFAVKYCAGLFIKSLPYYAALALFALYLCKNLKAPPSAPQRPGGRRRFSPAASRCRHGDRQIPLPDDARRLDLRGRRARRPARSGENRAPEILPAKPLGGRNGSASEAPSKIS